MEAFIGTKRINAKPMNRLEYNEFRGWELPADENGDDAGMLVEYVDGGKGNTEEFKGYVSWSPLDVFNRAYTPIKGMTFGEAIQAMKEGQKVCRAGWNGKGMFIFLTVGYRDYEYSDCMSGSTKVDNHGGDTLDVHYAETDAYIVMRTAQGTAQPGWLASQADILSTDWEIVND